MNAWLVAISAAGLVFIALFYSFDYWFEKIWVGNMLKTRDEAVKAFEDVFMAKTPEQVQNIQFGVAGGLAFLFLILLRTKIGVAIPVCALVFWYGWRLPLAYVKYWVRPQRVSKFSHQMVDALTLMANGLKSGLNIPQALQIVVAEMPVPIREEFGLVLNENKIGLTLEKAFENMAQRIPSEDVSMFVTSVNILRETGGNVAETFETITKTIRERIKLQNKISAMTAQGMTSAFIVGAMPWGIGIMLYGIDPETMGPVFTTLAGMAILLIITILEVIGFIVIMKMVRIRV